MDMEGNAYIVHPITKPDDLAFEFYKFKKGNIESVIKQQLAKAKVNDLKSKLGVGNKQNKQQQQTSTNLFSRFKLE
jgi:hypothetical protein